MWLAGRESDETFLTCCNIAELFTRWYAYPGMVLCYYPSTSLVTLKNSGEVGILLCMGSANERRRYNGWAHIQNKLYKVDYFRTKTNGKPGAYVLWCNMFSVQTWYKYEARSCRNLTVSLWLYAALYVSYTCVLSWNHDDLMSGTYLPHYLSSARGKIGTVMKLETCYYRRTLTSIAYTINYSDDAVVFCIMFVQKT